MSVPLSSVAIQEKNKIANSDSVFLLCMEIDIPTLTENIKIVANTENITWRGDEWIAFPFELDEISESDSGEVPRVDVKVSNVSREIEFYIHEYDRYCKENGFSPIWCYIYVVNSLNLDSDDPERELFFELVQPKTNPQWVTFTLGASNPFNIRFPKRRMIPKCSWKFKSDECGYSGSAINCNKTLNRCKELNNTARFGGWYASGRTGL